MKQQEPLVSVIVLTYNHEKYIRQALDSILMQETDFPVEILVGDDASTDGTPEILREYARGHPGVVRIFLRSENMGPTRNAYDLLMQAQGEYLAFCEGDDFWLDRDKLQTQVEFLTENPEFVGCAHPCRIVDEGGQSKQEQKLSWVKEKRRFTLRDFQGIYLPGQTATIVKRNLFRDSSGDYSFLYHLNRNISDRTSTLFYLTKGDFGHIPRTMSAYRRASKAGLTNQMYANNPDCLRDELEYTQRLERLADTLTPCRGIFTPYYRRLYASAVWHFFRRPSAENRAMVVRTSEHIGPGVLHPLAFVRGAAARLFH